MPVEILLPPKSTRNKEVEMRFKTDHPHLNTFIVLYPNAHK